MTMASGTQRHRFRGCIVCACLALSWRAVLFVSPGRRAITARRASDTVLEVQEDVKELEWTMPAEALRPGTLDDENFEAGSSVKLWKDFDPKKGTLDVPELTGADAPYWLYHFGRTGFFAAQGLASVAAANLASALGRSGSGNEPADVTPKFLEQFFSSPQTFATITVSQSIETFRQDLGYIKDGLFKEPYDMSIRHRQWSPGFIANKGLRYLREATSVLRRSADKADTSTWVDSSEDIYPPYFRHTFHYQTDGWLSTESAKVYEASTETLFLGRQDAMQRTTLVHIAKHLKKLGANPADTKLLEIGCGTGRVHTFIRDNWPSMQTTASDLSPFYLEEARKNNAYWQKNFAPASASQARFVQANAEKLPFDDRSFDIFVSVYMFHELPAEAQDAVFAEAARVLVEGGLFVLTDSVQLGDRPKLDDAIGRFGNFAEPHYQAYIRRDLANLARSHGLEPLAKEVSSATKSLSFTKPTSST